jgi:hypothetical protein
LSYFVQPFRDYTKDDFGSSESIPELGEEILDEENLDSLPDPNTRPKDRSFGELDVLSSGWIRKKLTNGGVSPLPSRFKGNLLPWTQLQEDPNIDEADQISLVEEQDYMELLKDFLDIFAWATTDLVGIPTELGEHHIDHVEDAIPIRQRQYMLNPKYSLLIKEGLDKVMEAGFIYPVRHSEWISPIVWSLRRWKRTRR